LLEREEKLIARKEKLAADEMVGGRASAGTSTTPKFTEEEKASRARIKAVADASGASWGKKYE